MTRQAIPLNPAPTVTGTYIAWRPPAGAVPVSSVLLVGGGTATMDYVAVSTSGGAWLRTRGAGDSDGYAAGPDFSEALERNPSAMTLRASHGAVSLPGPALWSTEDTEEPYAGTMNSAARNAFRDWLRGYSSGDPITLILSDGQASPERAARARTMLSPEDAQIAALEIRHPEISDPVRVVNDGQDRQIAGETYTALRFRARIADDQPDRIPGAELAIDNVGREIVQWIDRARETTAGISGVTVRVMLITVAGDEGADAPDYDVTMDVLSLTATTREVTARLGFDPMPGRPAVAMRHDPATSPGLF